MIRARCARPCFWQGKYWDEGEPYEGPLTPPRHFEVLEAPAPKGKGKKAQPKEETA